MCTARLPAMAVLLCLALGLCSADSQAAHREWTLPGLPLYGGIIRDLAESQGVLYAGTWGDGVFRSPDRGPTWVTMNDGLPATNVYSLAFCPDKPHLLYAGTSTGVFEYDLHDDGLSVDGDGGLVSTWGAVKGRITLHPIFPNPFNPDTWIPFSVSSRCDITIRVFDARGALVRTLPLGAKGPGAYLTRDRAAHWDGRLDDGALAPSGVYIATVSGHADQTRRMVLAR